MRIAVYLLAMLLLLPYFALATGFLVLGHAIAAGTLLAFLDTLLRTALWMIPWGLLAFLCAFVALIALAANERWRWLGGCCLCIVATASLIVIVALASGPIEPGQLIFLAPYQFAALGFGWVAAADLRRRHGQAATTAPVAR